MSGKKIPSPHGSKFGQTSRRPCAKHFFTKPRSPIPILAKRLNSQTYSPGLIGRFCRNSQKRRFYSTPKTAIPQFDQNSTCSDFNSFAPFLNANFTLISNLKVKIQSEVTGGHSDLKQVTQGSNF